MLESFETNTDDKGEEVWDAGREQRYRWEESERNGNSNMYIISN